MTAEDDDDLPVALTFEEGRVLGCLIEKAMTTPDLYPLTFNSLVAACNQKTNREPVVSFDDDVIEAALDGLRSKQLCARVAVAGARVPKYRHTLGRAFPKFIDADKIEVATTDEAEKLSRRRTAIIGVLLLRGQQTLAELRTRTERMYHFGDLDAVQRTLDDLIKFPDQALAKGFPVGGGRRVPTFIQLLTPYEPSSHAGSATPSAIREEEKIEPSWKEKVEAEIAELRAEINRLKTALGE